MRIQWNLKSLTLTRLLSKGSRGIAIALIAITVILAGHFASAQVTSEPPSLKTVTVPKPSAQQLAVFIKNEAAAIALGKAFFWDMQVGSDGVTACATCHFHAGADSRSKNQISPGLLRVNNTKAANPDTTFQTGGANYQLTADDFPFHKLEKPDDRTSTIVRHSNDIVSSQGVFNSEFKDVVPGSDKDIVEYKPDQDGFRVGNTNVRRVEPRNTPTVINAVYNFRQFWDGRAQNVFNGVNPFGTRDPNAIVYRAKNPAKLEEFKVNLKNSSLASQGVGPPLSSFEMSADGRAFQEIGDKLGPTDKKDKTAAKGKKLPRKMGKRILPLRVLGKQNVASDDSVLGQYKNPSGKGLKDTYDKMIHAAFKDDWWKSNRVIIINPADNSRTIANKPDRNLTTQEYTLMEYNFPLIFGLAVQMYESTLVSDNAPYDQYKEGKINLTAQQKQGLNLFINPPPPFGNGAGCIFCHGGPEFTAASVSNVQTNGRLTRIPGTNIIEDTGFFKIGVTPELEDLGVGSNDPVQPVSRSLSEAMLAKQGTFQQVFGEAPNITFGANDIVSADGNFKAPTLRNIELTAPYMHNGGMLTLEQVVEFYNRGAGDDSAPNAPRLPVLNLSQENKAALVAFMKSLTDERVRYDKAPFDHPELLIPNGHPGNQAAVTDDGTGTGKAQDSFVTIPAVGGNGRATAPANFLEASAAASTAAPSRPAPGGGYTSADCPEGTNFVPLNGGFVCQ
ncbi:MAG: cytochrome c peroxidase [Cyanobacteriota bacterium]